MQTEKQYEQDSHLRSFRARVLGCTAGPSGWEVLLDQTAFYPEGGGQPCDLGTLDGVPVTQVRLRDGELLHFCDGPLAVGSEVSGVIDWARRFDLMQQHSGEHIVSGLIHQAYGYENVGFHMGQDLITIDLSGELDDAMLRDIEAKANEAVCRDLPVRIFYPDRETLSTLPYRSKKELTGQVRLVEYPGVDLCACCGTHVARTGEIGLILLLSCVRFRGGARVEMLCGQRAVRYAEAVLAGNRQISARLSAKPLETADAVRRVHEELAQVKFRLTQVENQLFSRKAEALRGTGDAVLLEDGLDSDGVRRLAVAVGDVCGGLAAVFSGDDASGYKYALCRPDRDLRQLGKEMNAALNGRGGGKAGFVQGSLQAGAAEIRRFFHEKRS